MLLLRAGIKQHIQCCVIRVCLCKLSLHVSATSHHCIVLFACCSICFVNEVLHMVKKKTFTMHFQHCTFMYSFCGNAAIDTDKMPFFNQCECFGCTFVEFHVDVLNSRVERIGDCMHEIIDLRKCQLKLFGLQAETSVNNNRHISTYTYRMTVSFR